MPAGGDVRQLVEVGRDGFEDSVCQVLQVDDGDVDASLNLSMSQSIFRGNLIGEQAGKAQVRHTGKVSGEGVPSQLEAATKCSDLLCPVWVSVWLIQVL